jgi:hypothetical protein
MGEGKGQTFEIYINISISMLAMDFLLFQPLSINNSNIKGVSKKTYQITFCFPYIPSRSALIFKILVSTPHNYVG